MRRFFFLSLFLHGVMLMLLFSWEIPLAGKITPRNIIQVSLIEKGEDETPPPKAEKAAEKPKAEKRIAKRDPAPLPEPKETAKEIGKEDSKEEKIQKEEEARVEPASPPNKSGPLPGPFTAEVSQPSGNRTVEDAKGVGEEKKKPRAQEGGGAFLEVSLNPGPGKEGIAGGGGEKQARVLGGEGGNSERNPAGSSLAAVDPVLLQIMRRIEEAKRYPRVARRMGIEGKTVVRFKLKPEGQVEAVEVAESSGSDILDKASVETVREAVPLPYKEGWLKVGIVFKIL
jgi:protein TonB